MLSFEFRRFVADESGGGTIMGLFWFMLLVGICGLAVDITDGLRNRTMLQATADAAALAGVIDLPNEAAAKATAVAYSADNMGADVNGAVLDINDVTPGVWDHETRTFTPANAVAPGVPLDAVHVMVRRSAQNDNAVPVNFLRIVGLQTWNVRAQAIAQKYLPDCLYDGLIARQMVDISSNNSFVRRICVHGQQGVELQSNNYFEEGVNVSMMDLATLEIPASGMDSNVGLPEALRESSLDPRMVNHVDQIMATMIDPSSANFLEYIPGYISLTDDAGSPLPVIVVDEKFDLSTAEENRIYHVDCRPNKNVHIPNNSVVQNVVIIAECEVHIGSGATIMNSVIGSRSGGNGNISKANVSAAANVQLGAPDNCSPGGGVRIFSNATIHTSSSTGIDGVQMVAVGDIELGARDMGINGISAQSGEDIKLTSNNMFGLCSGGTDPLLTVDYYRLVL
jgi:Flp pilus assembly protein TadG